MSFNLAHALSDKGKNVLLIDADAQCNLTSMSINRAELTELYKSNRYSIAKALDGIITGSEDIVVSDAYKLSDKINILPGHINISEYEAQLPTAWSESFAGYERGFRIHSAIHRLSEEIASSVGADYIIYDLGPNIGSLNRSILLSSDYFVLPVTPDLFSLMAISTVGKNILKWHNEWNTAKKQMPTNLNFSVQKGKPKFAGYISQRFNINRGNPTNAFRYWESQFSEEINKEIINVLPDDLIIKSFPYKLPSLKNYHSLVPSSQKYNKPIFRLYPPEINPGHLGKVKSCGEDFVELANSIIERTEC